ncbi:bifunctional proline dehydrogenase/L-glutamate gamma-semialdehyde dehydrogenase PutA [Aestuariirhabdus litorea]|uniref:Bifunctional protein PutA n=1 Tax=Aestuariirhabdus litorea TaxID=2528527 RepID=A0A3P3VPF3_9GAMM|nr:bifunctional proline dehydrogenase/L-glutamate gamma-semialdehyde dehydrogenase PutA [Aestuariirhabdus litorea]RRJ84304.1 bifunctional proline dehydrogenase/L-glutamate gamma-semialdehyde dehydrogenase PutA [Aestuariirhabdus litorea]RWW97527.1 bifunctional proline dehydrogenase/L-glutamate gamma-semialdehyde dehydrogenase PutA [Endozoicomonadaceae bacterium GTF-13]
MFKATDILSPEFIQRDAASLKDAISPNYCVDEVELLNELLLLATPEQPELESITREASRLIEKVRDNDEAIHMIDALLLEYSLDTQEGILLMCLAEALMRVPDADTADALIRDKLSVADWNNHLSNSDSLLVNASTWGLMLTGKVITMDSRIDGSPANIINRLVNRVGEPVIRKAMNQAMKIMGKHFVLGRGIDEALSNARKKMEKGYTYSFDMLGEAALTARDADKYLNDYLKAIARVGQQNSKASVGEAGIPLPSVSIKLSALHPRYEEGKKQRVLEELYRSVLKLATEARALNVGITIDAEEMDRLELSLELFEKLYRSDEIKGWGNFGLVVQAYSKRALPVLAWLAAIAREQGDLIPLRLVKGAYWDSEIKLCQQHGIEAYPVFTRKEATDLSYLACARFLFSEAARGVIYPQFATHNAHTVACVRNLATSDRFEFQRLHGMGDALYNVVVSDSGHNVRIYAPVGEHKDLLPYLVRRLLENGANSSFVHRLVDANTPVASLVQHPAEQLKAYRSLNNDRIPLPPELFGEERRNSAGVNIEIASQWQPLKEQINAMFEKQWKGGTIFNGAVEASGPLQAVYCPYDRQRLVGQVQWASAEDVTRAIDAAAEAFEAWNRTPVKDRALCLERMADLMETHRAELIALCHLEAGKIIEDSVDEIREAVDFCRYYAQQARQQFGEPMLMPGPTGESNELFLEGRGVFACISPWNFPLAIFIGQVVAALVAGNSVVAKPAEQTSLIASRAVELLIEAGVPAAAIQLVAGEGAVVGNAITADERIAGVAFTGSTDTARRINRALANRDGAIAPLIAETGGQNAMIVDSTALPEQVVKDAIESAFKSAGQRCSALRVLYVQEDIAPRIKELLTGAMAELSLGDPSLHATDIGPVIDARAQSMLQEHIAAMREQGQLIAEAPLAPEVAERGYFVAPIAFQIDSMNRLTKENFGPVLHLVTYKASELDRVIEEINGSGYGLTLGVHTRNETTAQYIDSRVRVGNVYINRNQIGAAVGVQPFGGQGLSGTGPKAGGPRYLFRFATERTRTINTTAVGGNATLLSLESEVV